MMFLLRVSFVCDLQQRVHGDYAFKDVYELKEEAEPMGTCVRRRCLHRITAVEYSVKVLKSFF